MELKRKKLKGKLSPREATTFNKICSLEYDHVDTLKSWFSISEKHVSIVNQKRGNPATGTVELTRKEFEEFVNWYNNKQQRFSIRS